MLDLWLLWFGYWCLFAWVVVVLVCCLYLFICLLWFLSLLLVCLLFLVDCVLFYLGVYCLLLVFSFGYWFMGLLFVVWLVCL